MSAPQQPNPQPNQSNPQPSPVRIRKNSKSLFFLFLIMMAVIYVVFIHASTHHATDSPTQTTPIKAVTNITTTAPSPQNVLEYNFSLTNYLSVNTLSAKNGSIYIQFAGYFNEFPGLPSQSLSGNITILYVEITVYNGTNSKTVVLPLTSQVIYHNQKYFIYQVEGNIQQLRELAAILSQGEVIQFQFYTQTGEEIEGYTVW